MTMSQSQIEDLISRGEQVLVELPDHGIHTVSAVILIEDGNFVTGVNVYHFSGGPCAELVAIGAAVAQGHTSSNFSTIVAVGNRGRGVLNPCGRCRQILNDLCPNIQVLVKDDAGRVVVTSVQALLPFSYVNIDRP
ncbi:Blasticidin-S deaminase-like protein [Elsinoe fawcettii]|nr:Blasticidin-S deaminase-like protein [Elsinoe fawcettii]